MIMVKIFEFEFCELKKLGSFLLEDLKNSKLACTFFRFVICQQKTDKLICDCLEPPLSSSIPT